MGSSYLNDGHFYTNKMGFSYLSWDCLIFKMWISLLVRQHLHIETATRYGAFMDSIVKHKGKYEIGRLRDCMQLHHASETLNGFSGFSNGQLICMLLNIIYKLHVTSPCTCIQNWKYRNNARFLNQSLQTLQCISKANWLPSFCIKSRLNMWERNG